MKELILVIGICLIMKKVSDKRNDGLRLMEKEKRSRGGLTDAPRLLFFSLCGCGENVDLIYVIFGCFSSKCQIVMDS